VSRQSRLCFTTFDGGIEARIGHGADCAFIMLHDLKNNAYLGAVFTGKEAEALGRALIRQARYLREPVHG
jgi:hypothetical protein